MKTKNQWKITSAQNRVLHIIKGGLTVLISVLVIFTIVQAGTITPPSGTPTATFYSLTEIYNFIANNTAATEASPALDFSGSLAGTHYTLTQIYNVLAGLISADKVKLGTTYLNVAGTLVPSGGDATAADVLVDKTFFGGSQTTWGLQTGAIANCSSEGSQSCYAIGTYFAGTSKTPSSSATSQSAGYYPAFDLATIDTDLATGNIKSGVTIFGVDGNGNVVDTSSGDAANSDILSGKKAWVDGAEKTGSIANCGSEGSQSCYAIGTYFAGTSKTPSSSATSQSAGYYPAFDLATIDTDLTASKIMADVGIFGVTGTLLKNLFTGTSRSDSLSTVTLNAGGSGYTPGARVLTVTQSGASGGTVNVTVDAGGVVTSVNSIATTGKGYSVANNLATTGGGGTGAKVNITAVASHYPIAVGGVDDYNDNTTIPSDSYQGTWTDCSASPYCGTDSNADKKDNSTGLVWSKWLGSGATYTWFQANNCKYPNQLTGDDGTCDTHGEIACKCEKLTSGKTGCEALGWRLPSQKELMQAYINGSWANLSSPGYTYWSSTTRSRYTYDAWYTNLYNGYTTYDGKTNSDSYRVRCVR